MEKYCLKDMKNKDLRAYKNVDEIVEKLALQNRPTKIVIVEVPSGTALRKSIVGPQTWGTKPPLAWHSVQKMNSLCSA
jgi:hypothetical protein